MPSSYCFSSAFAFFLSLPISGVLAQDNEEEELALVYGDKATVSIATGSPQLLRRASSIATVITAEDIVAMGASDLDEVLESVPGLHVSRSPVRYFSLYLIRGVGGGGATNAQVLMLQNGIPMTKMFNGDRGNAWVGVPLENIARIEIIRGPGSALYGADAYAGVINVITKTAADTQGTEAGVRGGSFNTASAWVQHGGKLGPMDVSAYLRLGSTGGIREIIEADAQSRNDRFFGTRASLAPGPVNTGYDAADGSLNLSYGKWRWRGSYKLRDNLQTGAGVSSALDPESTSTAEEITTDLSWTDPQFARNWGLGFTGSYVYYKFTYPDNLVLLPPGTRLSTGIFPNGLIGSPNQWEREIMLSAIATYSGFAGHTLRFGLGHDNLDMYKTRTYRNYIFNAVGVPILTGPVIDYTNIQPHITPHLRKLDYLYVQDEWNLAPDWSVTAGVRHDRYSDFGGTTNPRVALVWDAALNVTAKLLYGRAFRAPSFNEQYGNNPVNNGNPNLRPETIKTLEAALNWQASEALQMNLSLFRYDMQDIIRAVPNPAPTPGSTYQNQGRQNGRGMELELVWDAKRNLRFTGNYAYQRSIDEPTGQDSGYAPHHHLYARADWRIAPGWLLSPQVTWVADRRRSAGDNRPPVPDYTAFDLNLRTMRGKGQWDFSVAVRNLFNADVREPSPAPGLIPNDLPMAPRAVYLQAIYRM